MRTLIRFIAICTPHVLVGELLPGQTVPAELVPPLIASVREDLPPGRIAFDSRMVCTGPSCKSVWAGEHTPEIVREISRLLSARVVSIEDIRRCERPGWCILADAEVAVALSGARVVGDTAIVVVRIWIDPRPQGLPRSVDRDLEVVLHRAREGWKVVAKNLIRTT